MFEKRVSAKERMRANLIKKFAEQDAIGWGESHPDTGKKVTTPDGKIYTIRRDGAVVRSKLKEPQI